MPAGELEINGYDAYTEWGVSLEDGALSVLMTPPSMKEYITNESRLENGTRYASPSTNVAQREFTLEMHIYAKDHNTFLEKYDAFTNVLAQGTVNIRTRRQITTIYKCLYVSCTQFSQFNRRVAKFALKLVEPDPTDREHDNSDIGSSTTTTTTTTTS